MKTTRLKNRLFIQTVRAPSLQPDTTSFDHLVCTPQPRTALRFVLCNPRLRYACRGIIGWRVSNTLCTVPCAEGTLPY